MLNRAPVSNSVQQKSARQCGRPRLASPKVHIGLRLDAEVVAKVKASGKGYNSRVEQVLRDAIAAGVFVSRETR
jgi:uncharacterized protein (DUF4415 family)